MINPSLPVLVTGGAGLIGSHLCARLLAMGRSVICFDNLSTGTQRNLVALQSIEGFEFVQGDVTERYDFDVSAIFNLACPASPPQYQKNPVQTLTTSVVGALHALELGRRCGVRVLQASTSEVYGDPQVHPQTEDYWGHVNPVGVRACYDEGKRCAETLFSDYHRQHGADIRIARIFNTYGPGMDPEDGRVVSSFIVQALRNEPLTVFGAGTQTRAFCFVADLVDGLVALMDSDDAGVLPVNLGNPTETTVLELAQRVIELTGSASSVVTKTLPADDPARRRPDITRARQVLGWTPQTALVEGVQKTIPWFEQLLNRTR